MGETHAYRTRTSELDHWTMGAKYVPFTQRSLRTVVLTGDTLLILQRHVRISSRSRHDSVRHPMLNPCQPLVLQRRISGRKEQLRAHPRMR